MKTIIVALDFIDAKLASEFVNKLDPSLCSVKVGKALFTTAGPSFIDYLHNKGFKVFLDLKFHDIPNTVQEACTACANLGVAMLTVHTMGGLDMLLAAKEGIDKVSSANTDIMGVTLLTSLKPQDLVQIGLNNDFNQQVLLLSDLAYKADLTGIVCSAKEASFIKAKFNNKLKLLTPGIRLSTNNKADFQDQSRVMTPKLAIAAGSDYLVIGRPITKSDNPSLTLNSIYNDISN